jgi:K+-sensing histidine kinase KdpD
MEGTIMDSRAPQQRESAEEPSGRSPVWFVTAALGAMILGIALIPLRSLTSASNLAFAFMAFTIVIAELGGRAAALVAAAMSALSLNFFLTEPYLTLAINKSDDVIAFLALAGCGLIAAMFGRRRVRWSALAGRAGEDLDALKRLVEQLRDGASLEVALEGLRTSFGFRAICLREASGRVLAASPASFTPPRELPLRLAPDTLFPADGSRLRFGSGGLRLPESGGRLAVGDKDLPVSLDLWEGDSRGLGVSEARALTMAALILGLELSRRQAV